MTDTAKTPTGRTTKKLGRPPRADPPRVSYQELDRLLVFGEMVDEGTAWGPLPSIRRIVSLRLGMGCLTA